MRVGHDGQLGAAARVPRPVLALADEQLGSGLAGHEPGGLDRVGPVGGAALAPPAGLLARPGEDDGDVPRLLRQHRVQSLQLRVGRAALHGEPHRDARLRGGAEDQTGLEERQVVAAAAVVAAQGAEEARQQRGSQRRLLVGERVDERDEPAGRVVRRDVELVEACSPMNG